VIEPHGFKVKVTNKAMARREDYLAEGINVGADSLSLSRVSGAAEKSECSIKNLIDFCGSPFARGRSACKCAGLNVR
jgi:hypothetical protein